MLLSETPFVIVDTETTGVRAATDRLIEIAAVRFVGGERVGEFSSLINPGQTIPRRITQITGITTSMVYDQPAAESVMPAFLDFLGNDIFVAHNLSFDLGFINAELARLKKPPLPNFTVCTLRLARRLLRGLRSKGLSSLIDFYGIDVLDRHRALGDARATAVVLNHFIDQAAYEYGVTDLEDFLRFQYSTYTGKKGASRHLNRIREEVLPRLPATPGVYFMKDRKGHVIYVGKAKSLRARVRSYFNAIEAHPTRTRNLIDAVADVAWTSFPSELEALLEESRLIKEHKPRFNRAQKFYRNRPFIRLAVGEPFPRITLSSYLVDDGAEYFGPMAGRREGELVIDLINRFFFLRECDDATFKRKNTCLYEDLHRCKAPCERREASPEWYGEEVDRVKAFLRGEGEFDVLDRLETAMRESAAAMEFEQAALFRDALETVSGLLEKQRYIAAPVLEHNGVVIDRTIDDGHCRLLLIRFGRLIDSIRCPVPASKAARDEVLLRLEAVFDESLSRPDRYFKAEIEDIRLLAQWLYLNRSSIDKIDWTPETSLDVFQAAVWTLLSEAV